MYSETTVLFSAKNVFPNTQRNINEKAGLTEFMEELLCKYESQQKWFDG